MKHASDQFLLEIADRKLLMSLFLKEYNSTTKYIQRSTFSLINKINSERNLMSIFALFNYCEANSSTRNDVVK